MDPEDYLALGVAHHPDHSDGPSGVGPTVSIGLSDNLSEYRTDFLSRHPMALAECRDKILDKPYPDDGRLYCNRTFDGWGCWNDTLAGTRAFISCPAWADDGYDAKLTAFKDCDASGRWAVHPQYNFTWSNYTTCINQEELARQQTINLIYIIGYSVSTLFLVVSLIIFFYFRQLRCTRISIHKNLFVSFVIHNVVWIIHDTVIPNSPDILEKNEWTCRLFHIFIRYILVCNYFWMFNEGLHLHTVVVFSFVKTGNLMKVFYVIGWGLPLVVAATYGVVRAYDPDEDQKCWINAGKYLMILAVPVVFSLLANFLFLCNIVRALLLKINANTSPEDRSNSKAVKAAFILVPLLGLQYMIFPIRPDYRTVGVMFLFFYDISSAVLTSFQGFFVALIYCFLNGEVRDLSRRDLKLRRESYELNHRRRSSSLAKYQQSVVSSSSRPGSRQGSIQSSPVRRLSQLQFHQDSIRLYTPSPGTYRRTNHFPLLTALTNSPVSRSSVGRDFETAALDGRDSPEAVLLELHYPMCQITLTSPEADAEDNVGEGSDIAL
ncbi:Calcitonin receptor [Hypsibius exemplaris]|uniref:Calcitonin receptor n=1 Tax=Hypsibius exemplaris TaxID=2072580 RepID=A0A9X6RLR2_HYPEX|nr:Calcitonin receptor [Hypsibius exemplaris]